MNNADLLRAKYFADEASDCLLLAWRTATEGDSSTYYRRTAVEQLEKLAKVLDYELVPAADIQGVR